MVRTMTFSWPYTMSTHPELCSTVDRQVLFRGICSGTCCNDDATAALLATRIAHSKLAEHQHSAKVHIYHVIFWLDQLPCTIELVFEVVLLLGCPCVGDGNVNVPGLLVGILQIRPRGRTALDECYARWKGILGLVKVQNVRLGTFGRKDPHCGESDARSAS